MHCHRRNRGNVSAVVWIVVPTVNRPWWEWAYIRWLLSMRDSINASLRRIGHGA